jgi:hypothetical protein
MFRSKTLTLLAAMVALGVVALAAQAAPLWTPEEITTTVWLDVNDATKVVTGTGGISSLIDKSGNGFDVAQSNSNRRPDYDPGGWSNGNDQLSFASYGAQKDTLGRSFTGGDVSGSAYTLFVVVNAQSEDGEEWIHNAYTTNKHPSPGSENRTQINTNGVKVRADSNNGGSATGTYVGGEQILQFTLATGASEVRRNGIQIAGNGGGTYTPYDLDGDYTVNGRNSANGHAGMTGDLGEWIYLAYNPDEETRQLIEGYLAWKWGLQGSLDGAHPYANAAPLIPEPASLALLGLGGLLIAGRRR